MTEKHIWLMRARKQRSEDSGMIEGDVLIPEQSLNTETKLPNG